jgi:hypothetical protein
MKHLPAPLSSRTVLSRSIRRSAYAARQTERPCIRPAAPSATCTTSGWVNGIAVDDDHSDDPDLSSNVASAGDLDSWREANYVDGGAAEVETPLKGQAVSVAAFDRLFTGRLEEIQCSREEQGLQLWAVLQSLDGSDRTSMIAIRSLDDVEAAN